jgi:hypothetical protein
VRSDPGGSDARVSEARKGEKNASGRRKLHMQRHEIMRARMIGEVH